MPCRASTIWASRTVWTGREADDVASGIRKQGTATVGVVCFVVGDATVMAGAGEVTGAVGPQGLDRHQSQTKNPTKATHRPNNLRRLMGGRFIMPPSLPQLRPNALRFSVNTCQ